MQAIITKYVPCTETKPSRVQAKCEAKTIYVEWDHSLNADQNHLEAAKTLTTKLGWSGEWVSGGTSNGFVFVCTGFCDKFKVECDK